MAHQNEEPAVIDTLKILAAVLKNDRRGVTAVEYALVAGALVLGIGVAFEGLTGNLKTYLAGVSFAAS